MNTRFPYPYRWPWLLLAGLLLAAPALAQRKPAVPPGFELRHGDILVRTADLNAGGINKLELWPNGVVSFEYDANVTLTNQGLMRDAMDEWEAVANVAFVQCVNNNCLGNFVHIQDSDSLNNSSVGMIGGQQFINITNWGSPFKIVHELGHCLGFYHEQSRPDRDNFITVFLVNIIDNKEHNYDKETTAFAWPKLVYGLPDDETYDFLSVMHYDDDAFCLDPCPGPTMTTSDPDYQDLIGQRDSLSFLDRTTMSLIYPENDWFIVDKTYTGFMWQGTLFDPFDDFPLAYDAVAHGSTLQVMPGDYNNAVRVYADAMVLKAPLGNVVLGDGTLAPVAATEEGPTTTTALVRSADAVDATLPQEVTLSPNYPNPFNPVTTLRFGLPQATSVHLAVYDLLGREVARLIDGPREAGWQEIRFDATYLPSGVYLYRLETGAYVQTRHMTLVK